MYEPFFGLSEPPFDLTPNPKFLLLTPIHDEALANLVYGLGRRAGLTVLIGEAGTGKTTLLRAALEHRGAACGVYVNNPALTRPEFIELLARRFGLSDRAASSKAQFLIELEQRLRQPSASAAIPVLVIDEAQSLPCELLEEVRLLANLETPDGRLLPVVLAGQPELTARLDDPGLRQLKQRIALRCELRPLTVQETAAYISRRIAVAGGVAAEIFTREAVVLIHERAGGIPRTISVLCDNALVTAFALGERPVSRRIVEDVCRDFAFGESPEAGGPEGLPAMSEDASAPASVEQPNPARRSHASRWLRSFGSLPARLLRAVS